MKYMQISQKSFFLFISLFVGGFCLLTPVHQVSAFLFGNPSSYSGGSGNFSNSVHSVVSGGQVNSVTTFSGGNSNWNVSGGGSNSSFAASVGGTAHYRNGDGTYNTITVSQPYPSPSSNESCCTSNSSPTPAVDVEVRNITKNGSFKSGNISIGLTDEVAIRWRGSRVSSCTASANTPDTAFSTDTRVTGTDTTVTEPTPGTSRTYTVTCTGSIGTRAASVRVTRPNLPMTTLYVKNNTQPLAAETTSDITIGIADEIQLRWSATNNPTRCIASADPTDRQFSTKGRTSGTDTTVTEPVAATSREYSVTCTNAAGSHTDWIEVTKAPDATSCVVDGVAIPTGGSQTFYQTQSVPFGNTCVSETRSCTNGSLSGSYGYRLCVVGSPVTPSSTPAITDADMSINAEPRLIRFGEKSTITWTTSNVEACTLTGPSLNLSGLQGNQMVENIKAESKFTLRCTLGPNFREESVTVKVLPYFQET